METSIHDHGQVSIVKVKGHVDSNTAPDLEAALKQLIEGGKNHLVLDLKEVDFLSSLGLRAMVLTLKLARQASGDLRLASPSPAVEKVLRTVGMTQMFNIYSSSEEAVAGF
jgi:anti-sigma B factor antagonist